MVCGKAFFCSEGSINPLNLKMLVKNFIPMGFEKRPQMAAGGTSNGQKIYNLGSL